MKIAITGHRPKSLPWKYDINDPRSIEFQEKLSVIVQDLGATRLITGMALGIDTMFARIAVRNDIPFEAYVPFRGQEKRWKDKDIKSYNKLLKYAFHIKYTTRTDYTWLDAPNAEVVDLMYKRNRAMCKDCDVMIAVWNGVKRGGAFHTLSTMINDYPRKRLIKLDTECNVRPVQGELW